MVWMGCLALPLGGCRPEDQRTETVNAAEFGATLDATVVAQLDSGNVAYRASDLESALSHYRRAIELAPESAAGWFGVYLVEGARGDVVAAEAALERARELAPGASLLRNEPPEMPEGGSS
jgi:tetratricopeptide (TPR) repeat protein